ncbi:hypothetical protein GIB67_012759 [Kingdonia uniflora]|uniref:UBC core domain-containing protein n=1 Tax=Kingdonia uniflora TaxID=39325 RepID=A0A7J7NFV1_9MAGN|nr:hypothetical protein GIB67_012759 [Kingdonia uniflora]
MGAGDECGDPGISAFPEEENIMSWKGTILGSTETIFERMEYKLSLSFLTDYPFKPLKVKFETACFHPIKLAIDSCGGKIGNDDAVVDQSENDKSSFSNSED